MALKINREHLEKAYRGAQALKSRMLNLREKGDAIIDTAIETLEVNVAAFGWGLVLGKYGEVDVMGVPGNLALGILLKVGGFGAQIADWDGAKHLHYLGTGFLASYFTMLGIGLGSGTNAKSAAAQGLNQIAAGRADLRALPTGERGRVAGRGGMATEDDEAHIRELRDLGNNYQP